MSGGTCTHFVKHKQQVIILPDKFAHLMRIVTRSIAKCTQQHARKSKQTHGTETQIACFATKTMPC